MRYLLPVLLLTSVAQAKNINVAERASMGVATAVADAHWPSIPTDNSQFTELRDPEEFEARLFARLVKKSGLGASGFELKIGPVSNILCDTERKYVLAAPEKLMTVKSLSPNPDLAITAIFAHEIGHYILDVYRAVAKRNELFGTSPFTVARRILPTADNEHAQVEPIAAELMRRAGFNRDEIKEGFKELHAWLTLLDEDPDANVDPSTDTATRKAVIRAYLAGIR